MWAQTADVPSTSTVTVKAPPVIATKPVQVNGDFPIAHQATEAQIREFMAVTHVKETIQNLMTATIDNSQTSSVPYLVPAFWDDMRTTMSKFDFVGAMVPYYQKHISGDDIDSIIAFYKTPAGQHFLDAQPMIEAESQAAMKQIGENLGREIYERHKDEINAAKAKYDQGQAGASSSSPGTGKN
jgi:hypothetical protein